MKPKEMEIYITQLHNKLFTVTPHCSENKSSDLFCGLLRREISFFGTWNEKEVDLNGIDQYFWGKNWNQMSTSEKRYFERLGDLTKSVFVLRVCGSWWVAVCSIHCFWFLHWSPSGPPSPSASWISWDTPHWRWPPPAGACRWPPGAARRPGLGRAGAGWEQEGGSRGSANRPTGE